MGSVGDPPSRHPANETQQTNPITPVLAVKRMASSLAERVLREVGRFRKELTYRAADDAVSDARHFIANGLGPDAQEDVGSDMMVSYCTNVT
jgi:hypothetical protein